MEVYRKGATQATWGLELDEHSIDIQKRAAYTDIVFQLPVPGGATDVIIRIKNAEGRELFDLPDGSLTQKDVDAAYARGMEAVLEKVLTKEDAIKQIVKMQMEKDDEG